MGEFQESELGNTRYRGNVILSPCFTGIPFQLFSEAHFAFEIDGPTRFCTENRELCCPGEKKTPSGQPLHYHCFFM